MLPRSRSAWQAGHRWHLPPGHLTSSQDRQRQEATPPSQRDPLSGRPVRTYHDDVQVRGRFQGGRGLVDTNVDTHPGAASPCTGTRVASRQWKERSVVLLAYAVLAGVIAWALDRRGGPWVLRLGEPGQQRARLAAGMLDTAVGAIGIAVLGLQLAGDDHAPVLGWTIGAAVSLGSVLYAAGLLAWRGRQALGLRVLGWVLLVAGVVIPSTLTLGLPLVALLALTLAPIPQQMAQGGPAT
jgi:hypothetical protein